MDKDCVAVVERKLKKMGVEVMLDTKAKSWEDKGDRAVLTVELKDGKDQPRIDADEILLSIGRRPNSENLGLEAAGVALDKRGFVIADDHLRTNVGRHLRDRRPDRRHDARAQGDARRARSSPR